MKYSDLTDQQLMDLANILSGENFKNWNVYKEREGSSILLKANHFIVYFWYDDGSIGVDDSHESINPCNLWKFFNKCKEFGINY